MQRVRFTLSFRTVESYLAMVLSILRLPKLGGKIDFDDDEHFLEFDDGLPKPPSHKPILTRLPATIEVIEFDSGTLGKDDVIARVPTSKVEGILILIDLLVGRIFGHVMNTVRNDSFKRLL